jgi:hypothetical protein
MQKHPLKAAILLAGAMLGFAVAGSWQPVMAASTINELGYPFPAGETWEVIQGYDSTEDGSHGVCFNGCKLLDFSKLGPNNSLGGNGSYTIDATLVAAVDGLISDTVAVYDGGTLLGYQFSIKTDDNYYVWYTHVNKQLLVTPNTRVTKGKPIATVYGASAPGGWYHLDFAVSQHSSYWSGGYLPITFGQLFFPDNPTTPYTCRSNIASEYCGAQLKAPPLYTPHPADTANITLPVKPGTIRPVYRFYNRVTGYHIWTNGAAEKDALVANNEWRLEGLAFYTEGLASSSVVPIYRARHKEKGNYFYSTLEEVNKAVSGGAWLKEGVAFYASTTSAPGRVGVYRLYNKNLTRHFYTTNYAEASTLISAGWQSEGTPFYIHSTTTCHNGVCPVLRMWNQTEHRHFYSTNLTKEIMPTLLSSSNWKFEGTAFYAYSGTGTNSRAKINRQYNSSQKNYYFGTQTSSIGTGWTYEGTAFYVPTATTYTLIREFKNNSTGRYYYGKESSITGWTYTGRGFRALLSY